MTTGSASKPYDGAPLTNGAISLSGAPDGVTARATGSRTDAGTSRNGYRINWNGHDPKNYEVTENLGTLTVTKLSFTVTTGSSSKLYDGTPLASSAIKLTGAPAGVTAAATGSQTNAGTSANTYVINWNGQNPNNYMINETLGTLTVERRPMVIWTGSATMTYAGYPLVCPDCGVNCAIDEGVTVTATGSQLYEGYSTNTCAVNWGSANPANYSVTYNLGGLLVTH